MKIKNILLAIIITIITSIPYSSTSILSSEESQKKLSIGFRKQEYSINFLKEFNHTEYYIHSALYSSVLTLDPVDLSPTVGLALSWFVNQTNDQYIFNLRNDAYFSDGTIVTARDIKESWIAAIKSNNVFLYMFEIIDGVTEYLEGTKSIEDIGIEVFSPRVLIVDLKEPAPYFLSMVTHPAFSISSYLQVQAENWDANPTEVVFSGPYIVKERLSSELILQKNPYFWDKASVYFDEIRVLFYTTNEDYKIIEDINSGKVLWATFTSSRETDTRESYNDENWVIPQAVFGSKYLFFADTQKSPWNNQNVRSAIKLLIPFKTFLNDRYAFPAGGIVPPIIDVYDPQFKIPPRNVEQARALLEAEGYPKGQGLGEIIIQVPEYEDGTYDTIFDDISEILHNALDNEVTIRPVDASSYYHSLNEKFTIGVTSWIGDFADPSAFLSIWNNPNPALGHNYRNEEYSRILSEANSYRGAERMSILQKAESYLLEDVAVIPLHYLYAVNVVRTDLLKGWNINVLDVHPFGALYLDSPQRITNLTQNTSQ